MTAGTLYSARKDNRTLIWSDLEISAVSSIGHHHRMVVLKVGTDKGSGAGKYCINVITRRTRGTAKGVEVGDTIMAGQAER